MNDPFRRKDLSPLEKYAPPILFIIAITATTIVLWLVL